MYMYVYMYIYIYTYIYIVLKPSRSVGWYAYPLVMKHGLLGKK